jgi:hypothetical protein
MCLQHVKLFKETENIHGTITVPGKWRPKVQIIAFVYGTDVESYLHFEDLFTYTHIAETDLFTPLSGKIHLTSKHENYSGSTVLIASS